MHNCDTPSSLLVATREALKTDTRTLMELHTQSGVPFYWLQRFHSFKSPSVNRVQYLYEFLTNTKIQIKN